MQAVLRLSKNDEDQVADADDGGERERERDVIKAKSKGMLM